MPAFLFHSSFLDFVGLVAPKKLFEGADSVFLGIKDLCGQSIFIGDSLFGIENTERSWKRLFRVSMIISKMSKE